MIRLGDNNYPKRKQTLYIEAAQCLLRNSSRVLEVLHPLVFHLLVLRRWAPGSLLHERHTSASVSHERRKAHILILDPVFNFLFQFVQMSVFLSGKMMPHETGQPEEVLHVVPAGTAAVDNLVRDLAFVGIPKPVGVGRSGQVHQHIEGFSVCGVEIGEVRHIATQLTLSLGEVRDRGLAADGVGHAVDPALKNKTEFEIGSYFNLGTINEQSRGHIG